MCKIIVLFSSPITFNVLSLETIGNMVYINCVHISKFHLSENYVNYYDVNDQIESSKQSYPTLSVYKVQN